MECCGATDAEKLASKRKLENDKASSTETGMMHKQHNTHTSYASIRLSV